MIAYAPPSPSPGEPTADVSPTVTTTTTVVPTELPKTGASDDAGAWALWLGIAALLIGVVAIALTARLRRN